jgi:hypothetical protein
MRQDSVASIATHKALDGLGIGSQWGQDFLHPYIPALWPNQPLVKWLLGFFPRGKVARVWYAGIKERIQLYFYSPFGPSWPGLG